MDKRKHISELQMIQVFHETLFHTEKCIERLIWTLLFLIYQIGVPRTETELQNKLKCFSLTF